MTREEELERRLLVLEANYQREIEERHKRMIELAGTEMKLDSVFAAKELGCSIKTAKRAMRALGIENTRKTKAG